MKSIFLKTRASHLALAGLLVLSAGLATATETKVRLSGAEETPAVTTSASGNGTITVGADRTISGSVTTKGIAGIAAHIHLAAAGQKGPPVITLAKASDDEWSVPAGSKLTEEQYASYQAGNLYINVHSAENKGGEIRGQLKP
jgi:hypothetical protein